MDYIDYIQSIVKQTRERKFNDSPQLSLGEFIAELEKCDLEYNEKESKGICFDFGSAVPTSLDSWRGSYSELALGYKLSGYDNTQEHFADKTSTELLSHLKETIGKEFTGWKGGEFTMNENTPVWVANSGNSGNTAVVGVLDADWQIVIITAYCEF